MKLSDIEKASNLKRKLDDLRHVKSVGQPGSANASVALVVRRPGGPAPAADIDVTAHPGLADFVEALEKSLTEDLAMLGVVIGDEPAKKGAAKK